MEASAQRVRALHGLGGDVMQEHSAIIEQIALYLGAPWKVNHLQQQSYWQREIIDGTGRGLLISQQYNSRKFSICGMFDHRQTETVHGDHKSIGVSITRPPKDIAADIIRRLLPSYLYTFETAKVRFDQQRLEQEQLDHKAQALVTVTGGRVSHHSCDSRIRTIYFTGGQAEIYHHSDEVKLTLTSLSMELAVQIAAMVRADKAPP